MVGFVGWTKIISIMWKSAIGLACIALAGCVSPVDCNGLYVPAQLGCKQGSAHPTYAQCKYFMTLAKVQRDLKKYNDVVATSERIWGVNIYGTDDQIETFRTIMQSFASLKNQNDHRPAGYAELISQLGNPKHFSDIVLAPHPRVGIGGTLPATLEPKFELYFIDILAIEKMFDPCVSDITQATSRKNPKWAPPQCAVLAHELMEAALSTRGVGNAHNVGVAIENEVTHAQHKFDDAADISSVPKRASDAETCHAGARPAHRDFVVDYTSDIWGTMDHSMTLHLGHQSKRPSAISFVQP